MARPHLSHARPQAPQTSPTWRAISRHQETWQAPQKVERLRQRGPQALQHGQRLVQVNPRQIKVATASIQRREGCYNNPGWAREGPPRPPTPEADAKSPSSVMKGISRYQRLYLTKILFFTSWYRGETISFNIKQLMLLSLKYILIFPAFLTFISNDPHKNTKKNQECSVHYFSSYFLKRQTDETKINPSGTKHTYMCGKLPHRFIAARLLPIVLA